MSDINLNNLSQIGSGSYLQAQALTNILDSSNIFSGVVGNELNYYNSQKTLLKDAALAKQRQIVLTDNSRKRYQDYSNMMFVVCIFLGVMLMIAFVKPMLPFIPEIVFDLLVALLGAGVVIYVIITLRAIQAHDNSNYDRLNIPAPDTIASSSQSAGKQSAAGSGGDLLGAGYVVPCVGAECCGSGLTYDSGNAVCVPDTTTVQQSMTTMNDAGWSNVNVNGQVGGPQPYNSYMSISF